ncbi:MAG: HEAT repeat domain-containing protein [Candidatus Methanospirareceae archaeon]
MADPIRILHVEDERGAREITRFFLERKGYNIKITPVLSAEQGLEKLEEEDFDVVVSDYKMPGMNGLEFLEELRKRGNDVPFIIFTGKGEERVAVEALNKGANRYIKKEGNPNLLFDTLGRYIQEIVEERAREEEREGLAKNNEHPLIQALEDRDWNVRRSVARALGEIKDLRAVEPLIRALEDEDEDVRKSAAWALGEIGSTKAVEPLIQALRDEKRDVRRSAVEALGKIGEPAVEPLIQALEDEPESVRLGAVEALGEIRDARAIDPLIRALKGREDNSLDIQLSAAQALGKIGDRRAVEPLIHALKDDREEVRWSAAGVLGEIGDRRAVEPLIHALKDDSEEVRKSAAWSLGEIRDKRAIEALIQALRDKRSEVRKSVAEALGKIGEPALEHLISALNDRDPNVQEGAAEAIGIIKKKIALGPISRALKVEDARKVAEKVLEMIRKSNTESLAIRSALEQIASGRNRSIPRRTVVPENEGVKRREEEVRLTPREIKEITDLHARGYRDSKIAERTGISEKSITKYLSEARARGIEATYLHKHRRRI